jgi:hypothetical protein
MAVFDSAEANFVFSYDSQAMLVDLLKTYCSFVTILSANG